MDVWTQIPKCTPHWLTPQYSSGILTARMNEYVTHEFSWLQVDKIKKKCPQRERGNKIGAGIEPPNGLGNSSIHIAENIIFQKLFPQFFFPALYETDKNCNFPNSSFLNFLFFQSAIPRGYFQLKKEEIAANIEFIYNFFAGGEKSTFSNILRCHVTTNSSASSVQFLSFVQSWNIDISLSHTNTAKDAVFIHLSPLDFFCALTLFFLFLKEDIKDSPLYSGLTLWGVQGFFNLNPIVAFCEAQRHPFFHEWTLLDA